jgi:hypothetical protein
VADLNDAVARANAEANDIFGKLAKAVEAAGKRGGTLNVLEVAKRPASSHYQGQKGTTKGARIPLRGRTQSSSKRAMSSRTTGTSLTGTSISVSVGRESASSCSMAASSSLWFS